MGRAEQNTHIPRILVSLSILSQDDNDEGGMEA